MHGCESRGPGGNRGRGLGPLEEAKQRLLDLGVGQGGGRSKVVEDRSADLASQGAGKHGVTGLAGAARSPV